MILIYVYIYVCVCVCVFFLIRLLIDVNIHVVSGKKTLKQTLQCPSALQEKQDWDQFKANEELFGVQSSYNEAAHTHTQCLDGCFFGEGVPKKIRTPATNHDDFKAKLSTMNEETGEWWR